MEERRFVALSVLLALVWGGTALAWLLHAAKDRARRVSTLVMVGFALAFGPIAFSKNGGDPPLRSGAATPSAPSISLLLAEVRTNAVFDLSMPSNAVVHGPWLRRGASDDWFWLHATNALFRAGTNAFRSVRVSARGMLAFPDGSRLEPFHAVLGVLPEPNWTNAPSRVWQAPAAGGGRLFTWEGAALERDPATPVSFQAELRRDGGVVGRYDLPHPATNFAIAAFGETALAVRGGVTNAATVRRVDGAAIPETSLAELLRDATRFELVWRAAEGDPDADPDGDGLTTRDEIGRHGTDPKQADTDGDGLSDAAEILLGSNPLDADENGDGVPDGVDPVTWAAHPLWAANGTNGANVSITLVAPIPTNAAATLLVGDLAIPLREPDSWDLYYVPGETYHYRLFVTDGATADLSIGSPQPRSRGDTQVIPGEAVGEPIWTDGSGDVFDEPTPEGEGDSAVPTLRLLWTDPDDGSHRKPSGVCLHGTSSTLYQLQVRPEALRDDVDLTGFEEESDGLRLSVPPGGGTAIGGARLAPPAIRQGSVYVRDGVHRCDAMPATPYCSICGTYEGFDAVLSASLRLLTLKHDNIVEFGIDHPNSPDETFSDARFEICQPGYSGWIPLSGAAWTARIAGTFSVRGRAGTSGGTVSTPNLTIDVQFPSETEMMADLAVAAHANQLWTDTLNLCTSTSRCEVGCWIRLDTATDTYTFTATTNGPPVGNDAVSYIDLGIPEPDSPLFPNILHGSAVYTVASLHTHTPTINVSFPERPVGPSGGDENASDALGIPSLVFDYVATISPNSENKYGSILSGHPTNAPAKLYPTAIHPRRSR